MVLLKPFEYTNKEERDYDPLVTDLDGVFHYCVVLTFNHNTCKIDPADPDNIELLFELAYTYCQEREVEMLSMWYDNSQDKKLIHYNLHIRCKLPLEYFVVLFDKWKLGIGMFWVQYMKDPVTWRVYASRNKM